MGEMEFSLVMDLVRREGRLRVGGHEYRRVGYDIGSSMASTDSSAEFCM